MVDVQLLFGPPLIGVLLNAILYGTVLMQTLIYHQIYRKRDPLIIKLFVYYLFFCETLNTMCDIATIYEPLIIRYGTVHAVTVAPIMLVTNPLLTVMISTPVQIFMAWRVKVMSQSTVLFVVIVILAICAFGGGIATMSAILLVHYQYSGFHKHDVVTVTWLVSSAVADVVITVSLVCNLMSKRTGFAATDDVINKIIRLTVQTGMVTTIFATIDLALFMGFKGTALNFIFDFPLSKLYSNSLLSTLNARSGLTGALTMEDNLLFRNGVEDSNTAISLSQIRFKTSDSHMERSLRPLKPEALNPRGNDRDEDAGSAIAIPAKVAGKV